MKERLKQSAKSTNFWNNISTIASSLIMVSIIVAVKDPEVLKHVLTAYLASSGVHNTGNVLAHLNKD